MRILYLDIDTLRPDHMSCYGYQRQTTPNLDLIAHEGVLFQNCYTSDAPCLPSRAALISGKFGILNGVTGHGGTAADRFLTGPARDFTDQADESNFFNIFRHAGFYTASISTFPERHSAWWFNAGLNEWINEGQRGGETAGQVGELARKWLIQQQDNDNWLLHVHLWDPHTPYRAPASFGNPFAADPLPAWIDQTRFEEHRRMTGPHGLQELQMYDSVSHPAFPRQPGSVSAFKDLRQVFDGYDCGVAYADQICGQIFRLLQAQGNWDDTAVIVTGDHGENLGELGIYSEHATADHPTCHIPLVIKWPGTGQGLADDHLHYQLDLLPTLADLLQQPHRADWSGRSFAPALSGGQTPATRDSLVLSQLAHVCQRSARFGDWLYIRTLHDGFHLFPGEMLFNITEDPYETEDLSAARPDICDQGARIILNWHDQAMLDSPQTVDPMWTVIKEGGPYHAQKSVHLARYLERLEKTGRHAGASQLRKEYGMTDPQDC